MPRSTNRSSHGLNHLKHNRAPQVGVWHTASTDGGVTWEPPQRASGAAAFIRGGGGGGVQLSGDGRMVAVCTGNASGALAACYSDDHGSTWQRGGDVPVSQALQAAATVGSSDAMEVNSTKASGQLKTEDEGEGAAEGSDVRLGSLGETAISSDGRGPRTLTLFSRASQSALHNHAMATSDDGGATQATRHRMHMCYTCACACPRRIRMVSLRVLHLAPRHPRAGETWTEALPISGGVVGPTCQGSISPSPTARGVVQISAPNSLDGSLNGRENLAIWTVDVSSGPLAANFQPRQVPAASYNASLAARLWGCKGAYTAFSQDGTLILFEGGETYRYDSILLSRLNSTPAA